MFYILCLLPPLVSRYRRLALKFHPSSNRETGSTEKFSELGEAYDVLSDRKYSREGQIINVTAAKK